MFAKGGKRLLGVLDGNITLISANEMRIIDYAGDNTRPQTLKKGLFFDKEKIFYGNDDFNFCIVVPFSYDQKVLLKYLKLWP